MTQEEQPSKEQTPAIESPAPEHVIKSNPEFEAKRVIVFPVDSSPNSKEALKWSIHNLINKETDQVVLVNVRNNPVNYQELNLVDCRGLSLFSLYVSAW